MDKNKIKNHLISRFISEETTPGISLTTKIQKDNAKINKDGVKDIEKNLTDMEKSLKKDGVDAKNMPANKFNYDNDFEKTYHDEMEIMNGQEMLQYDSEPSAEYKKRVKAGIEGSSTMGNQGGIGNAQAAWGASSDDFGKDLVKRAKSSSEKRNKQTPTLNLRGRDIQADMKDTGHRPYALSENVESTDEKNARIISGWMAETGVDKVAEKLLNRYSETGMLSDMPDSMEYGTAINKIISLLNKKQFTMAMKSAKTSATKLDKKAMKDHGMFENNDNNKPKIKEGMKRLKFKKEFNGVGNALKMIPESYRVDDKQFEMTDGNETYKIRWEGNLTEGRAVVLMASDKRMVNEDMAHMKHLMGYKSNETLGLVKGNARINENAVFGDIYNKSKMLLEGTDIESAKAKTGNLEDIKKKAPEATKHVQGSVSKDKGTKAPAAKEGDLDDAVSHAAEAKAHVQGSVSTEKGTKAPAAKNGNWEDVKKKSADATKHVTLKESFNDEEEEEEEEDVTTEEVAETKEVKTEGSDIEGTKASRTAPWEDHTVKHAPEAKAHVKMGTESKANLETEGKEMNEGITLGGIRFEPINESWMEEGMDTMMYPGNDFTKDTGNMMMDMGKQIMDKLRSVSIDFSAIPQEDVQKLGDFMTQVFGTATPSLNQENAKKLVAALGLNGLEEGEMGTFKDNESIVVKIIARIKQALGINIYAWVGVPLSALMASLNPDAQGAAFAITLIGGWILLGIFSKVLSKLGYNQDGDVAGYGHYDPSTDIRNK